MNRKAYAIAAIGLLIAGLALIGYSVREQQARDLATASRLYRVFRTSRDLSAAEAQALRDLFAAQAGIRAAFLQAAFTDAKAVAVLGVHEHALSVALSRVDRRDARDLFESQLLPCIEKSLEAAVLQRCFALAEDWSILNTLEPKERDSLAEALVSRIIGLTEQKNVYVAGSLTGMLNNLAPQISESAADRLTTRLSATVEETLVREQLGPLLRALASVASQSSVPIKSATARMLVERMVVERETPTLDLWGEALKPLGKSVPAEQADGLTSDLLKRIEKKEQAPAIQPLVLALNALAANITPAKAEQIANILITRMHHGDLATLPVETAGLTQLARKIKPELLQRARGVLMENLRSQSDAKALAWVAFSLGDLSDGVPKNGFDEAVKIVVGRISRQDGAYELMQLDGALANLAKVEIGSSASTEGAKLLVERLAHEHHIPEFLRVAAAIEILAKYVPEETAGVLVTRLIDRMQDSSAPSVLRALAFNIGDLKTGASRAQILAAAGKLRRRIEMEEVSRAVRELAAGLLNLGDEVPDDFFEDATAHAKELLKTETSDEGRMDLVATVQALEERDEDEEEKPVERTKLDEAAARKLLDPLSKQTEWVDLALAIAPAKGVGQTNSDDDDETADFHMLLVADDDEGKEPATTSPIDFNRLSDALDRYRQERVEENTTTPIKMTGVALMIVGLLLATATIRLRKSVA